VYDFDDRPGIPPPSWLLTAGELVRFPSEYAAGLLLDVLPTDASVGAGRPVLVLPGFGSTDHGTKRLRAHLARRGWAAYGWDIGANVGLTDAVLDGAMARLDELHKRHAMKVALVGWSFGGLLARWLAQERPGVVDRVVTLGSPWRAEGERTRATPMFERSRRQRGVSDRAGAVLAQVRRPLSVPSTAIWSKTDGIVGWRGCVVDDDEQATNISVPSSHLGLASNPFALAAVARALAPPSVATGR
jgi:pimeloyl-ACP methyl ester carboxylesterase